MRGWPPQAPAVAGRCARPPPPAPRLTAPPPKKSRSSPRSTCRPRGPARLRGGAFPLPRDLRGRPRAAAGEGPGVAVRVLGREPARRWHAARASWGSARSRSPRLTLRITDPGHGGTIDHPAALRRARLVRPRGQGDALLSGPARAGRCRPASSARWRRATSSHSALGAVARAPRTAGCRSTARAPVAEAAAPWRAEREPTPGAGAPDTPWSAESRRPGRTQATPGAAAPSDTFRR